MAARIITVNVTEKNIQKGKCGDTQKCAVAKAVLDAGFRAVEVTGAQIRVGKSLVDLQSYGSEVITLEAPKKVNNFVAKFDDTGELDSAKARKAARAKLKPFSFKLRFTDEQLTSVGYRG